MALQRNKTRALAALSVPSTDPPEEKNERDRLVILSLYFESNVFKIARNCKIYSVLIASPPLLISGVSCRTTFNKEL
jgi:hypothetical protein